MARSGDPRWPTYAMAGATFPATRPSPVAEVVTSTGGSTWLQPEQVEGVDGYDAVVVGSAVYAGHWLNPAREHRVSSASRLEAAQLP